MGIHADFSLPAIVRPEQYTWASSPQPGVSRVMLDRIGDENARATSIVRYDIGTSFPRHAHPDGEEILVLEGTFSDESGDYPAGWYLRNPPGSSHRPSSRDGALIFVKLRQMRDDDTRVVRIDTRNASRWRASEGFRTCPLFDSATECVAIYALESGSPLEAKRDAGMEALVLSGALLSEDSRFNAGTWLRLPRSDLRQLVAGPAGAKVYVKAGVHV